MTEDAKSMPPKKVCLSCAKEYSPDMIICPDDDTLLTPLIVDTLIGTTLADKYQILEKLGSGGMGLVYKARHTLMKRLVAIKLMLPQFAASATALKRFRQEAQAASHLNHPNILKVYDFGVTPQGLPYLVMDLLEGTNLSAELMAHGHLPLARSLNIFVQTCAALFHAHQKGVIHRDLKPGNIMMVNYDGASDVVQIVDFGMAKILDAMDADNEELTKTGEVFGSPMYMSPEQCMGKPLDARSDIYSLGCVMYRTLTGKPAVAGASAMECFNKHATALPATFSEVVPEFMLPASLENIVFRAMAKEIDDRYLTMNDLRDDLMRELAAVSDALLPPDPTKPLNQAIGQVPMALPAQSQLVDSHTQVSNPAIAMSGSSASAAPSQSGPPAFSENNSSNLGTSSSSTSSSSSSSTSVPAANPFLNPLTHGQASQIAANNQTAIPVPAPQFTPGSGGVVSQAAPAEFSVPSLVSMPDQVGTLNSDTVSSTGNFSINAISNGSSNASSNVSPSLSTNASSDFANTANQTATGVRKPARNSDAANSTSSSQFQPTGQAARKGMIWASVAGLIIISAAAITLLPKNDTKGSTTPGPTIAAADDYSKLLSQGQSSFDHGDYTEALKKFKGAFEKARNTGDYEHKVAEARMCLGRTYVETQDLDSAQKEFQEVLKIREAEKNLAALDATESMNELGKIYRARGQYSQAQQFFNRALAIRQTYKGRDHAAVAETLADLGNLALAQKQFKKATDLLAQAEQVAASNQGLNELNKANIFSAIGQAYQLQGQYGKATGYYEKALALREKSLNPENPAIADTLTYLGTLAFVQRDFTRAETYLVRALDIQQRTLTKNDPSVATTEFCLGVLYKQTKKFNKAEPVLADCLRIRRQNLGEKDADTLQTKKLYDQVKAKQS